MISDLLKYIDKRMIHILDVDERDEVLEALINSAYSCGKLKEKELFYNSILAREQVVSTGIGMGVALPHAKIPEITSFFIGIAILKRGIDWKALDGAPVRIVFMIGGPDDKQTEYLQVLSGLTHAVKDEDRRKRLLLAATPDDILAVMESVEE